uniref:ABC transporter domain-containing protein n=1 Tax=Timema genevievae TaxID=629358 RepID=A0A7R9PLV6_TIMGE|nr:unnamed protein product [Timema genevievae]
MSTKRLQVFFNDFKLFHRSFFLGRKQVWKERVVQYVRSRDFEKLELLAQLKMDRRVIPNQRKRRINSLMSELSLTKCCHTRLSALSGGEKKRLALAVQFLRLEESFIIEETLFADLYDSMTRGTMLANTEVAEDITKVSKYKQLRDA